MNTEKERTERKEYSAPSVEIENLDGEIVRTSLTEKDKFDDGWTE